MRKLLLRRPAAGKALVVGALPAMAVPGIAYANTVGVTVKTPGATMGPGSPFSEISTNAACSSGLISGGGNPDNLYGAGGGGGSGFATATAADVTFLTGSTAATARRSSRSGTGPRSRWQRTRPHRCSATPSP